jgi:membrane associated rhomboid family serine protease
MIPLRDDNPIRSTPVVNVALIALCVIAFLWEITLPDDVAEQAINLLGFIPAVFFGRADLAQHWIAPELSIVTSMFLHGGWMHLLGNMLYLWIFGDNIEDRVGHVRYALFYVLCGLCAALAQGLADTSSTVPMIGASGAISGVLGAYIVLYPRAKVLVVVPLLVIFYTLRVPAWLVLGMWFVGQLLSSFSTRGIDVTTSRGPGVAFLAHVGGFVVGVLLISLFVRDRRVYRY